MAEILRCGLLSARDGEGRVLFDGVELRLPAGQVTVLEGASGSGKSTLLRMVAGLVPTPRGVIRELQGRRFGGAELPAWRGRVTLLAQDAPVLPGSLEANLTFPFRLRSAEGRRPDRERLARLLQEVGLAGLPLEREARSLSGGERHRLALVRGLLWDPPVLMADEPLSGLDPEMAARCWDLLRRWGLRAGHAVLAVLHDPGLAGSGVRRLVLSQRGVRAA